MSTDLKVVRLERLLSLAKRVFEEEDISRLLEVALESAIEFTGADRGFVLIRETDGQVRVRAWRNLDRDTVRSEHFRPSRAIADRVLQAGEVIRSGYVPEDERFAASESILEMAVKSVLAIPIRSRDRVVGAIYLDRLDVGRGGFEAEDLRLLRDFGDVAAVALEVRRLVSKLETQGEELRVAKEQVERQAALLQEDVNLKSLEIARAERDLDVMHRALGEKYAFGNIVGRSPHMRRIFDMISQVIDYPVPVLITGESGTGKELIARALHHRGPRASEPFMAINCAAIPENLLESELFGYKRGAFTGATGDKEGLFIAARRGTLFLDEIGEMPLAIQGKLLRVLQEKEVRPIGGRDSVAVEARIVAATNRTLRDSIERGEFREDLFYRLNVVEIAVPPLRDRVEDIPALADHFLGRFIEEFGLPPRRFSADALRAMMAFPWPGNVRQLENAVKSSAILSRGEGIGVAELRLPELSGVRPEPTPFGSTPPAGILPPPPSGPRIANRKQWEAHEKAQILDALVRSNWNKTRAADLLGVSRRNLYRKLSRYGIEGGV